MMLVVGLGNPGSQYLMNRHNVGYMVLDVLMEDHGFSGPKRREHAFVSEGLIGGQKVLALKPLTFMNASGQAVASIARFYKIPLDDIIVVHDDLDLMPGKIRVRKNGGAGGHNGLRSIDATLGKDYWRLKVGIGHPGDRDRVTPYVLGNFSKAEQEDLIPLLGIISDEFPLLIEKQHEQFANNVARFLRQLKDG